MNNISVFAYRCPKKCFDNFDEVEMALIYEVLYSKCQTKDEQDLHLQRMIEVNNVQNHRPRKNDGTSTSREKSFKYHILLRDTKVHVCRDAFFRLYDVTDKRIKRIRKLLLEGSSPRDMRGKHPCTHKKSADEVLKIHEHISSFPVKKTHYSSRELTYLSSELSVSKMHELFKEKYPQSNIKYEYYLNYFNENFDLKFGKPQIDSCCFCEEQKVRIHNPHINEAAKRVAVAELMVHQRRAKKFTSSLQDSTKLSKAKENVLGLVFDYMQNISLPKIPVQEIFYLRQLTLNVFCVFNTNTDTAHYYVYHEGQAHKGPDEVSSFLMHYIQNFVPESVTELHLFSDNCPGQNKNHTLSRVCLGLTDTGRFKTVKQFFPLRGHSYNPCDRKFSVIKRPIKKCDRIYTPREVCELIANAEKSHPGTVTPVETDMIVAYSKWWPMFYKKNTVSIETQHLQKSQKVMFSISKYHYFEYSTSLKGTIKASEYIRTGELVCLDTFFLKKCGNVVMPEEEAYPLGKVPMKKNKLADIMKVMPYIVDEHKEFYNDIIKWPTTDADDIE